MGMMLALVMALAFLENLLPPLPMLPPGVKLGLSNIVVMYCVFFMGHRWALGAAALKAGFAALLRGAAAGLLSLCGGLLSVAVIMLLLILFREKLSYIAVSVCGAVAHNLGQITVASVLLATATVYYYLPVLIVSGVVMGTVTGVALKVLLPVFGRMFHNSRP
jgi:heptaprenyl diphosphate synthase